jgi:hypothetical protein
MNLAPNQKNAELVFKDYHLGLLAQITEYQHRVRVAEGRLEAEMTRAYNAESELIALRSVKGNVVTLRKEIDDLKNSTTWKVGRFFMLPIRVLRRIIGR